MSNHPHSYQQGNQSAQNVQMGQNNLSSDEEHSFTSMKLNQQNWEIMNNFEDSEMAIEPSSYCDQFGNSQLFIQNTTKTLGEIQEQKQTNFQESICLVKLQVPKQISLKKKEQKGKNIPRRKRRANYTVLPSLIQQYNLSSLKEISSCVCKYVEKVQRVNFHELLNNFTSQCGSDSKNLKRRMYDVINVLSAAEIISKKGLILTKYERNQPTINIDVEQKINPIAKALKEQVCKRQDDVRAKKLIILRVRQKERKLSNLNLRNQGWGSQVSNEDKIFFPFLCYKQSDNIKCHVSSTEAKISLRKNEKEAFILTQSEAISYLNLRKRKPLLKMKPQNKHKTIESLSLEFQ